MNRRELLAGSGAIGVALAAVAAQAAPVHPDAALIAACERQPALRAAYHAQSADDGPDWLALRANGDAIEHAVPHTIEGVLAKARAAQAEATGPNGQDWRHDGGDADTWAWQVVDDLLRVAGGAS